MYNLRIDLGLRITTALVWLINGIWCKMAGMVPRHEEIVGTILGNSHAHTLTFLIGIGETMIGIWILLNKFPKATAYFQIALILLMNTIETLVVPHLLLWGYGNILFAILFCIFLWYYYIHRTKATS